MLNRQTHQVGNELDAANGVVVGRDGVVNRVGVHVGIHQRDDRDVQAVGFGYRNGFAVDIHDKQRAGIALHVGNAAQIVLQLGKLVAQFGHFLFRQIVQGAIFVHLLNFAHARDGFADGFVVGQRAAQPAVHHKGLLVLGGDVAERFLRLFLGADKQNLTSASNGVIDELARLLQAFQRLLQVNNVDAVALPEQVLAHFGVPAFGPVAKMQAGFEQVLDANVLRDVWGGCHGDHDRFPLFMYLFRSAERQPENPLCSRAEGRRRASLPVLHTQNSAGNLGDAADKCKEIFWLLFHLFISGSSRIFVLCKKGMVFIRVVKRHFPECGVFSAYRLE